LRKIDDTQDVLFSQFAGGAEVIVTDQRVPKGHFAESCVVQVHIAVEFGNVLIKQAEVFL
jgi:hypothetical protein